MDIVNRLIEFKNSLGLTNSQFADYANIPRPTLSQFLNGRNKRLSDDLLSKLHIAYPELNLMWLLFNEGSMVTSENIPFSAAQKVQKSASSVEERAVYDQVNDNVESALLGKLSETNEMRESDIPSEAGSRAEVNGAEATVPVSIKAHAHGDDPKLITSIMVFYSDNSYEIFTPQKEK